MLARQWMLAGFFTFTATAWMRWSMFAAWTGGGKEGTMPEENKAEAAVAEPKQPAGRVWTDEEHDAYVKARIDKQAARFAETKAALDSRIAELEAANEDASARIEAFEAAQKRSEAVEQVAKETGLPAAVVANLKGDDVEALKSAAEAVKASVPYYPTAPAGATPGPVRTPRMTAREIADIRDHRERLAAIEANLDIFK